MRSALAVRRFDFGLKAFANRMAEIEPHVIRQHHDSFPDFNVIPLVDKARGRINRTSRTPSQKLADEEAMIQLSGIDVRLARYFKVFENHKRSVIDPLVKQSELTQKVEVGDKEFLILDPREYVLASTSEVFSLPDDLAAPAHPR